MNGIVKIVRNLMGGIMPNPNHCLDCEKPIPDLEWSHLCEHCADKHMNELIEQFHLLSLL